MERYIVMFGAYSNKKLVVVSYTNPTFPGYDILYFIRDKCISSDGMYLDEPSMLEGFDEWEKWLIVDRLGG